MSCRAVPCCADLQLVLKDFELDLAAALPRHWQQLLQGDSTGAGQPHSAKLQSRLLLLLGPHRWVVCAGAWHLVTLVLDRLLGLGIW